MIRLKLTSDSRQAVKRDLIEISHALNPTLDVAVLEAFTVAQLRRSIEHLFGINTDRMRTLAHAAAADSTLAAPLAAGKRLTFIVNDDAPDSERTQHADHLMEQAKDRRERGE